MATTVLTPTPAKLATPRTVSLGRQQLREFMESKVAVAGLALFVTIIAVAVLAPWISPTDPYDLTKIELMDALLLGRELRHALPRTTGGG